MKPNATSRLNWRYWVFFAVTGLVVVSLLVQYAIIMLFQPASMRHGGFEMPQIERGPILDRNGKLLAVSTKQNSATVWLPDVEDRNAVASKLAEILRADEAELAAKFQNGPNFQFVKRRLTQKESQAIREAKQKGELGGVQLVDEFGRSYPEKTTASQVVGYVGVDNVGLAGIEYTFNEVLAPGELSNNAAKTGASVWLTIDSTTQYYVESIAAQAQSVNKADRVTVLVMEAHTGALSAWAAAPGFDANLFREYTEEQRANTALTKAYEPGSVFKVFSLSTLLDVGVLKTTDTFECNGAYEHVVASSGEVIRIKDLGSYGTLNVAGILRYSSNAGTGYASDLIDVRSFEEGIRRYGFGTPTGINLIGETSGLLRPSSTWSARSKPTIAMGQEIGVSALQIVQAASALANGGVIVKPQIVQKVVSATGEVLVENGRQEIRAVIKPETADLVRNMLKTTIDEGTGTRAKIEGLEIAGKTGTAQVRDPQTGRYSEKNFIASILLYVPADRPRYIVYVTIENPQGASYLGGQIAAPVGKSVAQKLIQLAGIAKEGDTVVEHPGSVQLSLPPALVVGTAMPDLTGLSKRSLLPLLGRADLNVEIVGEGWAYRQSPPPGTNLVPGTRIKVELR